MSRAAIKAAIDAVEEAAGFLLSESQGCAMAIMVPLICGSKFSKKKPLAQNAGGFLFLDGRGNQRICRWRKPTRPSRPVPKSSMAPGMGTAAGVPWAVRVAEFSVKLSTRFVVSVKAKAK